MNGYDQATDLLRALAHPVRLQILEVLVAEREVCVCHLESLLGQRQAYVSQQLSHLREAGLVASRREGLFVFYSLADNSVVPLLEASRGAAVEFARRRGMDLSFKPMVQGPFDSCVCPTCESSRGEPAGQSVTRRVIEQEE